MSQTANSKLTVKVASVAAEAKDVVTLELRDPQGRTLPPFTAGSHLEIHLPNGLIRHYSLLNDPRETDRYVVGVGRAPNSRGGSVYIHEQLRQGSSLQVVCRNNFPLDPDASRYRFVAGGIGVTPIMAMIRWCEANGRDWRLVYAARNRQRAAFYEELKAFGDRVRYHFDDEEDGFLDAAAVVADLAAGEQVYCCGPQPLMKAVEAATAGYPAGTAHFEWFSAPADEAKPAAAGGGFEVKLRRSGVSFQVPADKSILDVLEENGVMVPFACRGGLCRTCETTVCGGEPEHLDYVLSQDEKDEGKVMMICVSRAKGPSLELDL